MTGKKIPPLVFTPFPPDAPVTFELIAQAFLEDYVLHRYRTLSTIRPRVEYLRGFFGGCTAATSGPRRLRSIGKRRRSIGC
jgi:hypothetical protein